MVRMFIFSLLTFSAQYCYASAPDPELSFERSMSRESTSDQSILMSLVRDSHGLQELEGYDGLRAQALDSLKDSLSDNDPRTLELFTLTTTMEQSLCRDVTIALSAASKNLKNLLYSTLLVFRILKWSNE